MLFAASIYLARRRRRPSPRRFPNTPPLWRLLLEELMEGARRAVGAVIRVGRRLGCALRPASQGSA